MPRIRITGDPESSVDRAALERARRQQLGPDLAVDQPVCDQPVCAAPSSQLVLDVDGGVSVCEAATCELFDGPVDDLRTCWRVDTAVKLRAQHEGGELPRSHCGVCAVHLERGLPEESALVRDYGALLPSSSQGPRRLVLRFGFEQSGEEDPRHLRRVGSVISGLDQIELQADAPLELAFLAKLVDLLHCQPLGVRPRLELRVRTLGDSKTLSKLLRDVELSRITLIYGPGLRKQLAQARELVSDTRVHFVLDTDNWFEVERVADMCADFGAALDLRVSDHSGVSSITELPLAEQGFLITELGRHWEHFSGEDCPSSLKPTEFAEFMTALRRLLRDSAEQQRYQNPRAAIGGQGICFRVPPIDHPLLADSGSGARLLGALLGLEQSPSLLAWAAALVREDGIEDRLLTMPWVRLLLLKVAMGSQEKVLFEFLAGLYRSAPPACLAEELSFADTEGIRDQVETWHEWFGLAQFGARVLPFEIGSANLTAAIDLDCADLDCAHLDSADLNGADLNDAEVTVLIPSYRHEAYIVECITSVLAQSESKLKVLVVDDRSPDDTVARARSIDDPRLTVRVNPENLGLGNSVLAALGEIDTPYVALLNSDDTFHPDRIRACLEAARKNPKAELVATSLHLIDSHGGEITVDNTGRLRDGLEVYNWVRWYDGVLSRIDPNGALFAGLLESNFLATSTNLFCKTDFLRGQSEALQGLKFCLDWQMFLEAAAEDALVYLPEKLAAYRLHTANTVWFREGRRWTYFLEVNRVVATSMRRYLERLGKPVSADARVEALDLIVSHLVKNNETHGLGVYMNDLLGGLDLEHLSTSSEAAGELIRKLNTETEHLAVLLNIERELGKESNDGLSVLEQWWRIPGLEVASFLSDLYRDDFHATRGSEEWLRERCDRLDQELGEIRVTKNELKRIVHSRRSALTQKVHSLGERIDFLERGLEADRSIFEEIRTLSEATDDPQQRLAHELDRFATLADHLITRWSTLVRNKARIVARQGELEERLESLDFRMQAEVSNHKGTLRHRDELRSQVESSVTETAGLRLKLDETASDLNALRVEEQSLASQVKSLEASASGLARERDALLRSERELSEELAATKREMAEQHRQWRSEVEALRASREWRYGNFFWNKLPLTATAARRLKKWYRRMQGLSRRLQTTVKSPFAKRPESSGPRVAAAASWSFPTLSHTFVYTELMGLREMLSADVCVMYWEDGGDDALHGAFRPLHGSAHKIAVDHETHVADKAHYRSSQPERYDELLARIALESGTSVEDLEDSYQLLQAFTFTRNVERFGAQWIQTYFYYEQSLFGLVAQWFLGIPRGISSYADHMLSDYDLKLIPLHMETADLVVATSERIKTELIGLTHVDYADKIIVKPNGVDGRRFPFHRRSPLGDELELLSISRLEEKKGLLFLVDAAKQLVDAGKRLRVHVIGAADRGNAASEAYAHQFESRIREHGLEDVFVVHGTMKQEAMRPIVDRCHAFVAPYVETESGDKDGIPTAILEAMSCGLPILATRAGSIAEIIDHEVEGLLCDPASVDALVQMLFKVYAEPGCIEDFSRAARSRFELQFDFHVTEQLLHDRMQAVLSERKES